MTVHGNEGVPVACAAHDKPVAVEPTSADGELLRVRAKHRIRDVVNQKLLVKMQRATDAVIDSQQEVNGSLDKLSAESQANGNGVEVLKPVDLRTAAYVLAIGRVAQVTLARGIWP